MMEIAFPKNKVLLSASHKGDELTISFIKKDGTIEKRSYSGVPATVIYPWVYKTTASEVLKYYAAHIRKKFKLNRKIST